MSRTLSEEQLLRVRLGDGTLSPDEESVLRIMLQLMQGEALEVEEIFSAEQIAGLLNWDVPRTVAALKGLTDVGFFAKQDAAAYALQERRRRMGEPEKGNLN